MVPSPVTVTRLVPESMKKLLYCQHYCSYTYNRLMLISHLQQIAAPSTFKCTTVQTFIIYLQPSKFNNLHFTNDAVVTKLKQTHNNTLQHFYLRSHLHMRTYDEKQIKKLVLRSPLQ